MRRFSSFLGEFKRHRLSVLVTLAIAGASALVLYLQHRAAVEIDRQAVEVAENLGRQRLLTIGDGVRRVFDGAVLETLFGASTETPSTRQLTAIARRFEEGHRAYPYVDRFFLWNDRTQAVAAERVLFFRRPGRAGPNAVDLSVEEGGGFYEIPGLSARLADLCRQYGRKDFRVTYAVVEQPVQGVPTQIVIRWAWMGDSPEESFVASGYLVDLSYVRRQLFLTLFREQLAPLLTAKGLTPESLYVRDEGRRLVLGRAEEAGAPTAEIPISMIFFPVSARLSRLIARPPAPTWTLGLVLSGSTGGGPSKSALAKGYWLSTGAVLLMITALALAIRANRHAERLAGLRASLVSSVTHQLRTPLSLLNLAGETMALGRVQSPEMMTEYIEVVRRETAQLIRLVEKTLEISRLEDSRRAYRFETVDLGALISLCVARFQDRLADREFSIRVQSGDTPLFGRVDAGALEQALVNLLDNAVRYSNGMKQIDVRIAERRRQAAIEVVDYGIGIPPEDLGHIFDKFFRGSNNRSVRSGFGLGLAIVQEIVQAHRGRVEVESAPNKGTTFRVLLRQVQGVQGHA